MQENNPKKILIGFLGNIHFDTRCKNLYESLKQYGHNVHFIGFDFLTKDFSTTIGEITVYKIEKKNPLFFYLKCFFGFLKKAFSDKYDIIFAEDVFALPALTIAARYKKAKIFYDSRELYGFLAALTERKLVQSLISRIESFFIKKVNGVIVTGSMDADFLKKQYNLNNTILLRNLPYFKTEFRSVRLKEKFKIPSENLLIIYQGIVVKGRGIRIALEALKDLNKTTFIIIGDGEYRDYYQEMIGEMGLKDKVFFTGKIPQEDLLNYTAEADLGLCLIENISISYYYALPNKLFEYIMADVPVVITNLPQMVKVVDDYKVGYVIEDNDSKTLMNLLKFLEDDRTPLKLLKENCKKAKEELNWEKEFSGFYKNILE